MECSGAPHDLYNHSVNALIFSDLSLPKLFFMIVISTGYATEPTTENISAHHMYQIAWSKRTDPALQNIQIMSQMYYKLYWFTVSFRNLLQKNKQKKTGDFHTYSLMI